MGSVRSVDRHISYTTKSGAHVTTFRKGCTRKPGTKPNGYLYLPLGDKSVIQVHRAVAIAFIDGDMSLTVNHKDGDKTNNVVSNLEWASQSENNLHAYAVLGKQPKRIKVSVDGSVFSSMTEASAAMGVHVSQIAKACARGHRLHGSEIRYVK